MLRNLRKDYPYNKVHQVQDIRDIVNSRVRMYPDYPVFKLKQKVGVWKEIMPDTFKRDIDTLGAALLNAWEANVPDITRLNSCPRIAILSETRYEWYVSFMAAANGLGIVVPLDRMLGAQELITMFKRAEIDIVLFSEKYRKTIDEVAAYYSGLKVSVCMEDFSKLNPDANSISAYQKRPIDVNGTGVLLFTSGTTSKSKIVMLSQRNICSDIVSMFQMCDMGIHDTFLTVLPLHHTYECTCGFIGQIYSGACIAVGDGLARMLPDMNDIHPSCLCIVPAILEKFYSKTIKQINRNFISKTGFKAALGLSNFLLRLHIDVRKTLFKSVHDAFGGNIRLVFMGGAPADKNVVKFFNDIGIEVLQGYGLTECAPLIAVNRDQNYRYDSCGVPIVGCEIKVFEPDENGIGEFIVKGNNVFLGYYGDEAATSAVFDRNGFFHTGDVGYIDKEGFLHITGRKKNVIIAKNGKNVFPEELEFLIGASQYVKEVIVTGEEDKDKNDWYIMAAIFPDMDEVKDKLGPNCSDTDVKNLLEKTINEVNKKLESYQHIKKISVRDTEFAKSSTHKIKRIA